MAPFDSTFCSRRSTSADVPYNSFNLSNLWRCRFLWCCLLTALDDSMQKIISPMSQPNKYPPLEFKELPVVPLEQLRPRLTQLTHSLRKFEDSLRETQPLPNWTTVQNQFNVILSQLTSFAKALDQNRAVLESTTVFPNYEFDTTQHEGLVTTLLRKKHLPEVDEWIDMTETVDQRTIDADDQMARQCYEAAVELLKEYVFGGYITKEEGERGVTVDELFVKQEGVSKEEPLPEGEINRLIYQGLDSKVL